MPVSTDAVYSRTVGGGAKGRELLIGTCGMGLLDFRFLQGYVVVAVTVMARGAAPYRSTYVLYKFSFFLFSLSAFFLHVPDAHIHSTPVSSTWEAFDE